MPEKKKKKRVKAEEIGRRFKFPNTQTTVKFVLGDL